MKLVVVKFNGVGKEYNYFTNLDLVVGGKYNIVADNKQTYDNPVVIIRCYEILSSAYDYKYKFRTITSAKLLNGIARPDDGLDKVIFNEGVTIAIWKDGTKTIIRCQEGDTFDKEKAIALCYMKKALGNRGSFNETLKRWVK